MSHELGVLKTAKLAMDEGLIERTDFDVIKKAFLKAQQIKAGMEAGFLREQDYLQARDSFLSSLDFQITASSPAIPSSPATRPVAAPPVNKAQMNPFSTSGISSRPAPAPPPPPPAPMPASNAHMPPPAPLHSMSSTGSDSNVNHRSSTGGTQTAVTVMGISDLNALPRIGRTGLAEGKKSMSGISVNEQCINIFNHMKTKSSFKWILYKIDDGGHEVVPEAVGSSESTYTEFVRSLPETECRYGAFDYAYMNADTGQTINKLVFVSWAPEVSSIRTKMMYASTKEFFKGFLDGVGAELQASESQELEESEMKDRVHHALTRK